MSVSSLRACSWRSSKFYFKKVIKKDSALTSIKKLLSEIHHPSPRDITKRETFFSANSFSLALLLRQKRR
jgi:hypothetical protein